MGDALVGRRRVLAEECHGGDDLARRAIAALGRRITDERLLDWMELVAFRDALDAGDRTAVGLEREIVAGANRGAVYQDFAGAAHFRFAATLGAGQPDSA